jgi:hypothetical protein
MPTPYIVERFNAVMRRGNLDFEAWFTDYREPDRSWEMNTHEWEFPYRFIPRITFRGHAFHLPLPVLSAIKPDLLVAFYSAPVMLAGLGLAKLRGAKIAL